MSRPALRLRRGGWQVLLLLIMALLGGCTAAGQPAVATAGPATPTPTATPGLERGTEAPLRLLYWQAPTMFNPHLTSALPDWEISRLSYEPLASFDKNGNLVPILAAEIPSLQNGEVSQDGRSVTWKLKQGVLWSDGLPFTAADVKFTYQFIVDPATASPSIGAYAAVSGVDVIDPYTIKGRLQDPKPGLGEAFHRVPGADLAPTCVRALHGRQGPDGACRPRPGWHRPLHRAEIYAAGRSALARYQPGSDRPDRARAQPSLSRAGPACFPAHRDRRRSRNQRSRPHDFAKRRFRLCLGPAGHPASLQELGTYYAGKLSANLGPAVSGSCSTAPTPGNGRGRVLPLAPAPPTPFLTTCGCARLSPTPSTARPSRHFTPGAFRLTACW